MPRQAAQGHFDRQHETRAIADVAAGLNELARLPLLDGALVEGRALSTTPVDVPHGLGRTWRGWIVVGKSANIDIWESGQRDRTRYLTLDASGTVTVSLWVF
jgi:hypothetical protein